MSNNIFSLKRFLLLWRQYFIHNTDFLLLSAVAYIGTIFIVLSVVQAGEDLRPHDADGFQAFLVGFVAVFGIVFAGHAFPAFRSKESTISYLMVPASATEKFMFEFISRIAVVLLMPLLFWVTFHLQGFFFAIFTDDAFQIVGMEYLVKIDVSENFRFLVYAITTAGVLLAFVLAFSGAAMFGKQPLVKSLFAVAVIVMFFMGYVYIVLEHLGLEKYDPPETMFLIPLDEVRALQMVSLGLFIAIVVMLFVAFRKLKEREV